MKDTMMFMLGAAAGVGAYMGVNTLMQNKNSLKHTMNDLIDDAADLMK